MILNSDCYWNPCRFHWNPIIYKRISGLNVSLQVHCPGRTTTMAYSVYWWYGHFSHSTWNITHHFWNGGYQDIDTFNSSLSWEQQFSRAVQYWQWYCRGDIQPHSGVESAGYVTYSALRCPIPNILVVTCMCTCTFCTVFSFYKLQDFIRRNTVLRASSCLGQNQGFCLELPVLWPVHYNQQHTHFLRY